MESKSAESLSLSFSAVDYRDTGFFGKIVLDYLADAPDLRPFYHRRPDLASFPEQLAQKAQDYTHREVLVAALKNQYASNGLKSPTLDLLADPKTFTITTGHQVCLFTGPLYFIYKILSAIRTSDVLTKENPNHHFVPVFWMATEDHDFEEANHFFLPDGKISWESGQGGAVGRMTPEGMEELAAELREKLGIGYHSGALLALFEKAYLKHNSIADATRFLVHKLFGHLGVIAVDGDDPALKSLAAPVFKQELLEGISSSEVEKTNESLSAHYDLQVHTRDINLFYLDNQLRERIVRREDGRFEVLHTRLQFSEAEMLDLLEKHPERFSPNVILRGLYQEIILPNLAYIGGGGELAYWFQLKGVFTAFKVPFPILMLRNSLMFVSRQANELMQSLELTDMDLFVPVLELENRLVNQHSEHVLNLDASHDKLEQVFLDIETKLREIDQTLERSVRSGYARTERIVKNLEKKMLRAERRKLDTLLGRLQKLRESLFPRDGLQERNMNFVVLYEAMGPEFIEKLLPLVDPFDAKFAVVKEMV